MNTTAGMMIPTVQKTKPVEGEEPTTFSLLPIANVSRIMKRALPENAKIAKDAKHCVQEAVSEFISFITSEASEKCLNEKRKTVNGEDVLWAMQTLGFENYSETLKLYLHKYRESSKTERFTEQDTQYAEYTARLGPGMTVMPDGMPGSSLGPLPPSHQGGYQYQ